MAKHQSTLMQSLQLNEGMSLIQSHLAISLLSEKKSVQCHHRTQQLEGKEGINQSNSTREYLKKLLFDWIPQFIASRSYLDSNIKHVYCIFT